MNRQRAFEAIVIGASAGGVDALLALLPALPAGYPRAVVVVLHVAEDRDSRLAEIFDARTVLPVREAADKEPIRPGTIYFAGAGYHLSIERDRSFSLSCEPPVHFSRPSIDILMESAADAYGEALLGILLTGASEDGAAGLCRIQASGGMTVVQDPVEAQVPTMPQAALAAFTPDRILTLPGMRALLLTLDVPDAS